MSTTIATTRIGQLFERCANEKRKAFIAYLTAGDPNPEATAPLVHALERGGADLIELGVPFSDPIADGPVVQRASERALQAGTTSFSDWFLFLPKREGDDRRKFIEELAPLDPVKYIGRAAGSPVLLQFGKSDPYVPRQKAQEFFDAAKEPKKILWYEAGHALNGEAIHDRQEWLKEQLHLNRNGH